MNMLLPEVNLLNSKRLKQLAESTLETAQVESALIFSTNGAVFAEAYRSPKPMRFILNDAASLAAAYGTHLRSRANGNLSATDSRPTRPRDATDLPVVYESSTHAAVMTRVAEEILLAVVAPLDSATGVQLKPLPNGLADPADRQPDGQPRHASTPEDEHPGDADGVGLNEEAAAGTSDAPSVDPTVLGVLLAASEELTQELRHQWRHIRYPDDF